MLAVFGFMLSLLLFSPKEGRPFRAMRLCIVYSGHREQWEVGGSVIGPTA
ncbi:hypothetical protein [Streptomyces sp. NPDC006925]